MTHRQPIIYISLEIIQLHHTCCSSVLISNIFTESLRSWNDSLEPRYYANTEHDPTLHMLILHSSLEHSDDPNSNKPKTCCCNNLLTIFCFYEFSPTTSHTWSVLSTSKVMLPLQIFGKLNGTIGTTIITLLFPAASSIYFKFLIIVALIFFCSRGMSTVHAIFITIMSVYLVFLSGLFSDRLDGPVTFRSSHLSNFTLGVCCYFAVTWK
jgi:hypothetical protein